MDSQDEITASVRDSANITIVENLVGSWNEQQAWFLDEHPHVRVGSVSGSANDGLVNVSGAVALSDGRIVVADNGVKSLKVFDSSGRWLRDVGGDGDGPGEFRSIRMIRRFAADSIFVFDWSAQRYSILDDQLTVVRTQRINVSTPGITLPHIKDLTERGIPILVGARPPWVEDPIEHYGQPGHVFVANPQGLFEDEIARFTGQGRLWKTLYATSGERLVVIPTGTFEFQIYDLTGTWLQSVRYEYRPRPIPDDFFQQKDPIIATLESTAGHPIAISNTKPDPAHYPRTLPAIDQVFVDADENVWLRETRWPALGPQTFVVFRSDGQLRGSVVIPERLEILAIGRELVLALFKDDFDVEFVEQYRLNKPE